MLRPPFSQESISIDKWDVIVIGAGAAGLMTCLELPENLNVLLLNRNTSKRSSSRWAQGGIASVIRPEDSFALHASVFLAEYFSLDGELTENSFQEFEADFS